MCAGGTMGGVRAQLVPRQTFVFLNMHPINKPGVIISNAKNRVDASGKFTEPAISERVKQLLVSLDVWTRRLRKR